MVGTPVALSDRDLRTMVGIVTATDSPADSVAAEPGARLPWPALHGIRELLGCDDLTFCGLEPAMRRTTFSQTAYDGSDEFADRPADDPADHPFWVHYWDASCSYPDRSGDLRGVVTPYDFASERQWLASPLYLDYFRPGGMRHSMLLTLPDRPGRTIRLIAFRADSPRFSERDRAVLMLLRPHLYAGYLQWETHRQAGADRPAVAAATARRPRAHERADRPPARRRRGHRAQAHENIHSRLGVTSRAAALAQAFPDRFAPSVA